MSALRWFLAAAVAMAMGATTLGAASAATNLPRCHTRDLAGRLERGSPGAGQRYATLLLRNRSSHRCRVFGYIGAQLLGSGGRALPTRIVRDHSLTPRTVVLRPGRSAQALLHWGAIPSGAEPQSGPCEPTPQRIEITPPDETTQLIVPWRFGPVCQRGRIDVRPLAGA
jgi:hypothetical protein